MTRADRELGDRLASLDQASSGANVRYRRGLEEILEERLSFPVRVAALAAGCVCSLFGVAAGFVVFSDDRAYAYWPNLALGGVATMTALAIGVALIVTAFRGVHRRRFEGRIAAWSGALLLATCGFFMLLAAFGLPDSLRELFLALGMICLGAGAFVAHRLSTVDAQLSLERRLLEIELRLVEISARAMESGERERRAD